MNGIVMPLIGLIHSSIYPPQDYQMEYHDLLNSFIAETLEKLQFPIYCEENKLGIPFDKFREKFENRLNEYFKVANESENCPIRYFLDDINHIIYKDGKFYNLFYQNDMIKNSLKQVHLELKDKNIYEADILYLSIMVFVKGEPLTIINPGEL